MTFGIPQLDEIESLATAVYAQSVCAGHERTLARHCLALIARIRGLEQEIAVFIDDYDTRTNHDGLGDS